MSPKIPQADLMTRLRSIGAELVAANKGLLLSKVDEELVDLLPEWSEPVQVRMERIEEAPGFVEIQIRAYTGGTNG